MSNPNDPIPVTSMHIFNVDGRSYCAMLDPTTPDARVFGPIAGLEEPFEKSLTPELGSVPRTTTQETEVRARELIARIQGRA